MPLRSRDTSLACIVVVIAVAGLWSGVAVTEGHRTARIARAMTGGDAARAPALLRRYGCSGCHTIAGVPGADGQVGGPLSGLRHRVFIAGVADNSPDNLVAWIVSPQRFSPRSAMPATGISTREARDVAAYLYAH